MEICIQSKANKNQVTMDIISTLSHLATLLRKLAAYGFFGQQQAEMSTV